MPPFVYGAIFEPGDRRRVVASSYRFPMYRREMKKLTHVQWQRRRSASPR
jgi:hypothetical protein